MAGAAPTTKPAPFFKPLDVLDRGVLLAENTLSTVVVVLMLFAAVAQSSVQLFQGTWWLRPLVLVVFCTWLSWTQNSPSAGTPELPLNRRAAISALGGVGLGLLSELLARVLLPSANDLLLHGTIWAAFLGASFATRGRKHLAIDAVSRLLPERGRRGVVAISAAMGAFVAFALAKGIHHTLHEYALQAAEQARREAENNVQNSTIRRDFEFQFVIPGGFLLIGVRLMLHSFHEFVATISGKAHALAEPEKPALKAEEGAEEPHEEQRPMGGAIAAATASEASVAIGALLSLNVLLTGVAVRGPLLILTAVSCLGILVPLALRYRRKKNLEPDRVEPHTPPEFNPAIVGGALLASLTVLGTMAYVLAPRLQTVSIGMGVGFFVMMALLGAPLFTFLGGTGLFLFMHGLQVTTNGRSEWMVQPQSLSNSVEDVLGNHFATMSVLATIPLFTLAGYVMSESRMPHRLVRVSRALLGWMPGGLAVVCLFASAFFTIFSGASGITIVAVGGLLFPALMKDRYPERFSMGLVTTGGALGITIPPCLPLIVYGIVAGLQEVPPGREPLRLREFLLAGLIPGLLTVGLIAIYAIIVGLVAKVPRTRLDFKEAGAALWEAKWELFLPVILLFGLARGIFNPSQAAAFTAFYVVVIEVFVYRDLTVRGDLPRIIPESMTLVGAIFVKLCAATVLVGYFVQAKTADTLFEALTCGRPALDYLHSHPDLATCHEAVDAMQRAGRSAGGLIHDRYSFLIALNVFLLVVGMLMDIFSAIVVVVPLISGIALYFDINPYHLGIVFLLNLEIGYLMPPMGLNLFIAGFRFGRPVPDLYRMVLPFIGVFVVALLLITYIPPLTLATVPPSQRTAVRTASGMVAGWAEATLAGHRSAQQAPQGGRPADCDNQRDDENLQDYARRCRLDPTTLEPLPDAAPAGGAGGTAPSSDCENQRDDENLQDYIQRCNLDPATMQPRVAGASPPTEAPTGADAGSPG